MAVPGTDRPEAVHTGPALMGGTLLETLLPCGLGSQLVTPQESSQCSRNPHPQLWRVASLSRMQTPQPCGHDPRCPPRPPLKRCRLRLLQREVVAVATSCLSEHPSTSQSSGSRTTAPLAPPPLAWVSGEPRHYWPHPLPESPLLVSQLSLWSSPQLSNVHDPLLVRG